MLELAPADDYAHYALGRALRNQGRHDEAATHLKLARSLRPRNADRPRPGRAGSGLEVGHDRRVAPEASRDADGERVAVGGGGVLVERPCVRVAQREQPSAIASTTSWKSP